MRFPETGAVEFCVKGLTYFDQTATKTAGENTNVIFLTGNLLKFLHNGGVETIIHGIIGFSFRIFQTLQ